MGYFLASLSLLVMLSGALVLVVLLKKQKRTISPSSGNDEGDDEGGLPVDWDAPLDLPPGVYTLPPEPVHA